MNTRSIRLLYIDSIQLNASLWTRLLEQEDAIAEANSATSTRGAKRILADYDVVVLGTSLNQADSLAMVQHIATSLPSVRTVISGLSRSEQAVVRAVEAGASGLILRDDSVDDAVDTIMAVAEGHSRIAPDLAQALMDHLARLRQSRLDPDTKGERYAALTEREREVLELIAREMSNRDIAEALSIEVGTVKNHVHNLLTKLDLNNRQLAARYLRSLDPVTAGAMMRES